MSPVTVTRGDGPIVLGQPHGGTHVPDHIARRLNERGLDLSDTDWHIGRLYDGLLPGVTVVAATFHRYVVDANRDPAGTSLYPGQNTTGLCPQTDFDGEPIWRDAQAPGADEVEARRAAFHAPYHEALSAELERVKARHGYVILYDCHSIRSRIPYLFEGALPVFNIGTADGTACDPRVEAAMVETCAGAGGFDRVLNGRFKGGWTTRHYGRPAGGVHAIQLELAQRAYMDEAPPWNYRPDLAGGLRPHLARILERMNRIALAPDGRA